MSLDTHFLKNGCNENSRRSYKNCGKDIGDLIVVVGHQALTESVQ